MQEFIGKKLSSTITPAGNVRLSLSEERYSSLKPDEVLIEVEASPINPSDIGVMFSATKNMDVKAVKLDDGSHAIEAEVHPAVMPAMKVRLNVPFPCGNEGAGMVVAAGEGETAQALLGKRVTAMVGGLYAQYRVSNIALCMPLPKQVSAEQGASCFVNPLTALVMIETMRMDGHTALAHTAAASNLGQMLQKICLADGVKLVNIVRKQSQVNLLKSIGAEYVVNSSEPDFKKQLFKAFKETGATLAFDATGGGTYADNILGAMEQALNSTADQFNTYGSSTVKQVYLYGGLERSPTTLTRTYGMYWTVGGFILPGVLQRIGTKRTQELQQRVFSELDSTFASHYTSRISLEEMLEPEVVNKYRQQATGEKYLVQPNQK